MGKPTVGPSYTAREEHRGVFHRPYLEGRQDQVGYSGGLADLAAPLDEIWASYRELVVNKEEMEETMEKLLTQRMILSPPRDLCRESEGLHDAE